MAQAELVATPSESVQGTAEPHERSTDAAADPSEPAAAPAEDAAGPALPGAESAIPSEPAELPPIGSGSVAAEPNQEMGFSESTLLWLVDGDKEMELRDDDPAAGPLYDPSLVSARRRTIILIGGAGIVALIVALALHGVAARHHAPAAAESAPAGALIQPAGGAR